MKKIAALVVLSFAAMSAAQAQQYVLTEVLQTVPFGSATPDGGFSGSATVSGSDVLANVSWSTVANVNAAVEYDGSWSTEIGNGVDILKLSETCVQTTEQSRVCGEGKTWTNRNGLLGDWINGQDMNGDADARYFNNVSIVGEGVGIQQLIIIRNTQFIDDPASPFFAQDCPFGCQELKLTYTLIPVPGAVWLFASALGMMAWIRRRTTVA